MKIRERAIALLLAAVSTASLPSCTEKGGSGPVESMVLTINDSAASQGKWNSSSDAGAILYKGGSVITDGLKVSVKDAAGGSFYTTLNGLDRVAYDIVVYSPASLTIAAGQGPATGDVYLGSAQFTPKDKTQSIDVPLVPATGTLTVSVNSQSTDYSGWNLTHVSLVTPSPAAGTLEVQGKALAIKNGVGEVMYEIPSPTSLRTKAQTVTFHLFPALGKGSKAKITYSLEKDGKRVSVIHDTTLPESLSAGGNVTISETIPASLGGDWSAQGSGVQYNKSFPGKEWETTTPESRGYSSVKLENFRKTLQTSFKTSSLMVAVGGKVIFTYGDVTENVRIASCRKSLMSTMYGKYVENGTIDLSKTLRDLGIDEAEDSWGGSLNWDGGKLLESEKDATILDLITARSGCFHKPSNSGDDHDKVDKTSRGKYKHGEYFLYNNWDFNCAGGVFEMLTGKNIYAAFKEDIADPCGWQDYSLSNQKKTVEFEGASQFPAYHFWISTRDMLRFALLMLNKGNWDGKQVVSEEWATRITSIYTPRADMHPASRLTKQFDYGYLWWLFCKEYSGYSDIFEGGYTATGSGGQYITVLPALDMVLAHKDKSFSTDDKETLLKIVRLIAACREEQ